MPIRAPIATRSSAVGGATPTEEASRSLIEISDSTLAPGATSARDAGGSSAVEGEGAAQQRAPRKSDRDVVGAAAQLRGRLLRGSDGEQRVRRGRPSLAVGRHVGRLGHRRGVGVEPEDDRRRLASSPVEDGSAVAGSEVDDDSVGGGETRVRLSRRPPRGRAGR